MKPIISSRKHYVQDTEFTIASAAVTTKTIVKGVAVQNVDQARDVTEGAVIKAVFFEYWMSSNVTNGTSFVLIVEKTSGAIGAPTFSQMSTLDAYPNKKNILFTSQGLLPGNGDNPVPLMRQWVKIPKGKQRMGLEDSLRLSIATLGSNAALGCGFTTFKSFQ